MKYSHLSLVTLLFPACLALAAEPVHTENAQAQMQAEQSKKQAFADALRRYLSDEPARMQQLDKAIDSLYSLAFKQEGAFARQPDPAPAGLSAWQKAIDPLHSLNLPRATVTSIKALEQSMKTANHALSAIPVVAANASSVRLTKRQQALMAAADALGALRQQALRLDDQLEDEARRAASAARMLSVEALMLPAPIKEKP
ncbi:hypothetical protein [Mariprofundus ferrooxydans]|uniref:Uncharacterized protein n=1 Tax=Mariprofundus ferrooxydans PV-1 TaxID=314345 RepID=Q0EZT2_9PROT|nr:hypothetical protein [Mariprofundus ferrooxydans]EAU54952.1 hypothetical protein SPV1_09663 [Mariprofundus ferrooxydans PV-1]KON46508.1 hypothetical protein AL013_12855 [Mariprofundus ferrooxydans]